MKPLGDISHHLNAVEVAGFTYPLADDELRLRTLASLAEWSVKSVDPNIGTPPGLSHKTSMARLAREGGGADRWVSDQRNAGLGIVLVGGSNDKATAIATVDFAAIKSLLPPPAAEWFVLAEPAKGWENTGVEPSGQEENSTTLLVAAGVTIGIAVLVYFAWGRK